MSSSTKIILSLLAAAAAGAAAGVLMAPEKGTELRKRIRTHFTELAEDIAELLAIGQEQLKDMYASASEDMHEGMENVKSNVSEGFGEMQHN